MKKGLLIGLVILGLFIVGCDLLETGAIISTPTQSLDDFKSVNCATHPGEDIYDCGQHTTGNVAYCVDTAQKSCVDTFSAGACSVVDACPPATGQPACLPGTDHLCTNTIVSGTDLFCDSVDIVECPSGCSNGACLSGAMDCTSPEGNVGNFWCDDVNGAIRICDPANSGQASGWAAHSSCDTCEIFTVQTSTTNLCKTETDIFCYRCGAAMDGTVIIESHDACPSGFQSQELTTIECQAQTTCYQCGELGVAISQTVIGTSCPANWQESILTTSDCGGDELVCTSLGGTWVNNQCECEGDDTWFEDVGCLDVSPGTTASASSIVAVTLEKSDIRSKTTDQLVSSACVQDSSCLNLKGVDFIAKCNSVASLRDAGFLLPNQDNEFLTRGKSIFKAGLLGGAVGVTVCAVGIPASIVASGLSLGASLPFALSAIGTCAPLLGGLGAGVSILAADTVIDMTAQDDLVKAFDAEDASAVGLCVYEAKQAGSPQTCPKFISETIPQWLGQDPSCTTGWVAIGLVGLIIILILAK